MTFSFLWRESRFRFARDLRLARVFGFDERFQIVEAGRPEDAVLLDPGIDGAKRLRIQLINPIAAFAVFADQMGAAEKSQVLGDGRAGDGKGFGDLSSGLAAATEKIEDGATGGVGEGLEGGFGPLGSGICN